MASVFCVLVFLLLFAIVMVNTASGKHLNARSGSSVDCECVSCGWKFFPEKNSTGNKCDILCTCIRPEFLSAEMEAAIANDDSECASIGYHFSYSRPRVSAIKPGWLKTSAIIKKVTIMDDGEDLGRVTDIEPGAFNDCTFRELTELVIEATVVTVLRNGVFDGASSLKNLIMERNGHMRAIESSTLDPLYQLEEIWMVEDSRFVNLVNFTGCSNLKHVRTLNLKYNNFSTSINAETFKGCTSVETINRTCRV